MFLSQSDGGREQKDSKAKSDFFTIFFSNYRQIIHQNDANNVLMLNINPARPECDVFVTTNFFLLFAIFIIFIS